MTRDGSTIISGMSGTVRRRAGSRDRRRDGAGVDHRLLPVTDRDLASAPAGRELPAGTIINSVEAGRVLDRLAARDFVAGRPDPGPAVGGSSRPPDASAPSSPRNASHLAFERIDPPPSIPLIHIVEATRDAAARARFRRVGLIGTRFVMESDLLATRLVPAGIEVVIPIPRSASASTRSTSASWYAGIIRDESRAALTAIVAAMRDRDGIEAIVLGGTELALVLTESTCADLPVLNTAQIQVDAAVDWLLAGRLTPSRRPARILPRRASAGTGASRRRIASSCASTGSTHAPTSPRSGSRPEPWAPRTTEPGPPERDHAERGRAPDLGLLRAARRPRGERDRATI